MNYIDELLEKYSGYPESELDLLEIACEEVMQLRKKLEYAEERLDSKRGVLDAVDHVLQESKYYHASRAMAIKMILEDLAIARSNAAL